MSTFASLPRRYNLRRELRRRLTILTHLDRTPDDARVPFPHGRDVATVMETIVQRLRAKRLDHVTFFRGARETDKEAALVVEERSGLFGRCWVVIYAVRRGDEVFVDLVRGAPTQLHYYKLVDAIQTILVVTIVSAVVLSVTSFIQDWAWGEGGRDRWFGEGKPAFDAAWAARDLLGVIGPLCRFMPILTAVACLCLLFVIGAVADVVLSKPTKLGEHLTAVQDRLMLSCKMAVQDAL